MNVRSIELKHFRCFKQTTLAIDSPLVLIEGINGVGKTSLLEALYYACYLRSFRTHLPTELVHFEHDDFFLRITIENDMHGTNDRHEIQVGFCQGKRLVKVNKKTINSYKELMDYYRVISVTEDDIMIIKGDPENRRSFIDQAILLQDPTFADHMRDLKKIVENRNSLLKAGSINQIHYKTWTEQLWKKSHIIQEIRIIMLGQFAQYVNELIRDFFNNEFSISFEYTPKKMVSGQTLDQFLAMNLDDLLVQECRMARSVFGAHVDDFIIKFQDQKSKRLASRGQQKLIVLLLKIAQMHFLTALHGPGIFLLDDFMTDFDSGRAQILIKILKTMRSQLIFTSPVRVGPLHEYLMAHGAQVVSLHIE